MRSELSFNNVLQIVHDVEMACFVGGQGLGFEKEKKCDTIVYSFDFIIVIYLFSTYGRSRSCTIQTDDHAANKRLFDFQRCHVTLEFASAA